MLYSGAVAVVNPLGRELVFKIVYYGPGLGGKTTTLQHIHATTKAEHRGRMVSLATPVDRTLYFDFLPIRVPNVRDLGVRLQLFTVPGQVYYNATRKLVLTGADGVVFVADSQRDRMDANLESWENLRDNLREHGRILAELPHVLQFNKRDLAELLDVNALEQALNPHKAPTFGTVATTGVGVYEALEAVTLAVLSDFEARMPNESGAIAHGLGIPEGGLVEALRNADRPDTAVTMPSPTEARPESRHEPLAASPSGLFTLSLAAELTAGENAARILTEGLGSLPSASSAEGSVPAAESPPSLPAPVVSAAGKPGDGPAKLPSPPPIPSRAGARPPPAEDDGRAPEEQAEPDAADSVPPSSRGNEPIALNRPRSRPPESPVSPAVMSFAELWPAPEHALVLEVEASLGARDYARAVVGSEKLVARALAAVASVLGSTADAPRDPAVVALLLGVQGARTLEFRALVREARTGRAVSEKAAVAAYAYAVEVNLARCRTVG
jgi:signal recognition particle receptor subunit beta